MPQGGYRPPLGRASPGGWRLVSQSWSVTLEYLNALDREPFTSVLCAIYEHSPWVAEKAWDARPFDNVQKLEQAMQDVVSAAGRDAQLKLLRLHPRLGIEKDLSGHSRDEQVGAGLTSADDEDLAKLKGFNIRYESRFGFPYIVAVKGMTVADILANCMDRIANDPEIEFRAALDQVYKIAQNRLADIIATHF